jgi:hypothetical protein
MSKIPHITVNDEIPTKKLPKINRWKPPEGLTRLEQEEAYYKSHLTSKELEVMNSMIDNYLEINCKSDKNSIQLSWWSEKLKHPFEYGGKILFRNLNTEWRPQCILLYPPKNEKVGALIQKIIIENLCTIEDLESLLTPCIGKSITSTACIEIKHVMNNHLIEMSYRLGIDWKEWIKLKIQEEGWEI